jgi:dihydropyrimidinase
MSTAPAHAFGIDHVKGSIGLGKDADLVLVDLQTERTVSVDDASSMGLNVATGRSLRGWPRLTCARGRVTYDDELIGSGGGRVITTRV